MNTTKTHFRKAFKSPYLSSADITGNTTLTIARVELLPDATKQSKDMFNTAYFAEKELRPGEKLKPMILNAHNSKVMRKLTGAHYLEDWVNVPVTVYVDPNVKNRGAIVEGLRISDRKPQQKPTITPDKTAPWNNAKAAYKRDGNFDAVLVRANISEAHKKQIIEECASV